MAWLDDDETVFDREEKLPEVPDNELPAVPEDESPENPGELAIDRTVVFGGREFTIEEPDTATILAMLNWVGMLGVRANRFAGQSFKGLFIEESKDGKKSFVPPAETTIFSMLSVVTPGDIGRLAILAFFGGSRDADAAGRKWLADVPEKDLKIAPVVKALTYRVAQAEDLREALKNLQLGAVVGALFQRKPAEA